MKKKTLTNKVLFLFLILISSFLFENCKKLNIDKDLRIDIGNDFDNDSVTIKLDNQVIFSKKVSTDDIISVAEVLHFNYPIGRYELTVNVNGIEKKEKFRHKNNRFIYISFNKNASKITIIYPDEEYIYD